MNVNYRNRNLVWVVIAALLAALALASMFVSCAGAPRSLEQLEQMDQAAYDKWLLRVRVWAQAAAWSYVDGDADKATKARGAAAVVRVATGDAIDLLELLDRAGVDGPLAAVLAVEANALIEARGGWPTGERLAALLDTIADGVEAGAAESVNGALQPGS